MTKPIRFKRDLSDLREKCDNYLEHTEERERITENAYWAFVGYFEPDKFLDKLQEILDFLDLNSSIRPESPRKPLKCVG